MENMLLFRSYVAASAIEGVGVFTSEDIAKGAQIWRPDPILDVIIAESEIDLLPEWTKEFVMRYGYPSNGRKNSVVIEADNGRFMNHSLNPNTDFKTPQIGIAICDIPAGQEVTCNYGDFYEGFELMPPAII